MTKDMLKAVVGAVIDYIEKQYTSGHPLIKAALEVVRRELDAAIDSGAFGALLKDKGVEVS